jgi:hypothetical protein
MRILSAALAVIMGVALLAACGGGEEKENEGAATATAARPAAAASDTGTPGATASPGARVSPTASAAGGTQTVGCEFPSDIKSFRFTMSLKANLPTSTTPTPEAGTSGEGLSGLLGALGGLMGDMTMEGSFITPDSSSVVMTVGGNELGSFIQIGSKSWMKVAGLTDWTEEPASADSGFSFSPTDVCQSMEQGLSTALSQLEGKKETVNGIKAVHYHADKADLALLQDLLGTTEDLGNLNEFTMDVWLAEDGKWPVRMNLTASGQDAQGQAISFDVSIEFKDFNDSSIKIEPPT